MRFDDWLAARTRRHASFGRRVILPIPMTELRARYEAGVKLASLATAFGCSTETIRNRLMDAGATMRRGRMRS